jgi:hypothetical protein
VKRLMVLVVVALVMVVIMLAVSLPVSAESLASVGNQRGFGPKYGNNYGQCTQEPGNGIRIAENSPSFQGGPGTLGFNGTLCGP